MKNKQLILTILKKSLIVVWYYLTFITGLSFMMKNLLVIFPQQLLLVQFIGSILVLLLFLLYNHYFKFETFNLKSLTKSNLLWSLYIFFICKIVMAIVMLFLPVNTLANQVAIESATRTTQPIIVFLLVVILAPILEELLFRSLWMQNILKGYPLLGLIVSTLTFAFMHTIIDFNWPALIIYSLLALPMGITYWKTKSLECAIFVHMLNNLLAFGALMALS